MAVVVESFATTDWTGVNTPNQSLTINKPSGVAVGDLLMAIVGVIDEDATTVDIETPSGWTVVGQYESSASGSNATCAAIVYTKTADSGDVSASNYSFRNDCGEAMGMAGIIYRLSGGAKDSIQVASDLDNSNSTTFANTVTPNFANSHLFFAVVGVDINVGDSNNDWAIVTDNPSWTEDADLYNSLFSFFGSGNGAGPRFACANAYRPETTATGNSSMTFSDTPNFAVGLMIVVPPQIPVSISVDASGILALSQGGEPTYTLGFIVDIDSPGNLNLSGQDNPVTAQEYEEYTEQSKTSTSWTNQSK